MCLFAGHQGPVGGGRGVIYPVQIDAAFSSFIRSLQAAMSLTRPVERDSLPVPQARAPADLEEDDEEDHDDDVAPHKSLRTFGTNVFFSHNIYNLAGFQVNHSIVYTGQVKMFRVEFIECFEYGI